MVTMSGSMSPDGRMSFSPSFGGAPNLGGPSFGGPGGFGSGGDRDRDRGLERLREQDRDNDGRVSRAEADRQLQPNFERIDRDNDGYITLEEYRAYYSARENERNRDGGNGPGNWAGGGWGGPDMGGGWGNRQDPRGSLEDPKPVAIRYGHLPKDLPEWFHEYDTTKDGQIALHEWIKGAKAAGEDPSVEAFAIYDLNGDQLITADEVLRYERLQADAKRIAAIQSGESTRPSFSSPGGGRMRSPGAVSSATNGAKSDAAVTPERGPGKRDPERKFEKRFENSDKPVRGDKGDKGEQSPGSNGPWGNGGKKNKG
jgi:Ca2+-binding EF-hand superfamily protein